MKTHTFEVHLSNKNGELIAAIIEQANELMAVLVASKLYPNFIVDSVAQKLHY